MISTELSLGLHVTIQILLYVQDKGGIVKLTIRDSEYLHMLRCTKLALK